MPPWLSHVRSAQSKESKFNSSRWLQLATIGIDNTPRVRTVVFRGWNKSNQMEIYTDKRSQKYNELDLNNNVEVCWLFLKSKCQFRFRGKARIGLGENNIVHWEKLSDKSKLMWTWPTPGAHFVFDQERERDNSDLTMEDISNNFVLINIDITHVDQLLLREPMHIRRNWVQRGEWIEERINP